MKRRILRFGYLGDWIEWYWFSGYRIGIWYWIYCGIRMDIGIHCIGVIGDVGIDIDIGGGVGIERIIVGDNLASEGDYRYYR